MVRLVCIALALSLLPLGASAARLSPSIEKRKREASRERRHSVVEVEEMRELIERGFFEYAPRELASPSLDPFTGDLFVGTRDGRVRLFDGQGRRIWEAELGAAPAGPARLLDATIHVGTSDGRFWSLDRFSGDVLWSVQLRAQVLNLPAADLDRILVGTDHDEVHALDLGTGESLWVYRRSVGEGLTIRGGTGVAVEGDRAFAGFSDGSLVALSVEDGRMLWQVQTVAQSVRRFPDSDATPEVRDGRVFSTVFNDGVYAFDASDGSILWRYDTQGADSLTLDGELLLVGGGRTALALVAETGARAWSLDLGSSYVTRPVVSRKIVFLAGPEGIRMVDRKTGRPLGHFQPGSGFRAAPVAREDRIWALSNLGFLFRLRVVATVSEAGW